MAGVRESNGIGKVPWGHIHVGWLIVYYKDFTLLRSIKDSEIPERKKQDVFV